MEAADDVGNVVLLGLAALIVQRKAVGLHVIKPNIFGAARAGFGEHQHRRGNTGVRLEHTGGHGDHSPELVVLHQLPADGLMRF